MTNSTLYISFFLTVCFIGFSFAQTTIWSENFNSYPNYTVSGAGTGASPANWYSTHTGNMRVIDARLVVANLGGEGIWYTDPIAITGYNNLTFTISPVAVNPGGMDNGQDYTIVEYRIDGGTWTQVVNASGSTTQPLNAPYSVDIASTGSTMELRVRFFNSAGNEDYTLDDVLIQGTVASANPNDDDGDGVPDTTDLDDDNDGILDTSECDTYDIFDMGAREGTNVINTDYTTQVQTGVMGSTDCSQANITIATTGGGFKEVSGGNVGTGVFAINETLYPAEYCIESNVPLRNLSLIIDNLAVLDASQDMLGNFTIEYEDGTIVANAPFNVIVGSLTSEVSINANGVVVPVVATSTYHEITKVAHTDGKDYVGDDGSAGGFYENGARQFGGALSFSNTDDIYNGIVRICFAKLGPGAGAYLSLGLVGFVNVDTDGDGFINKIDKDSDGDACTDADEAYGDTNADGNDDAFGYYGTGNPPAVNANGTVVGASYQTPADGNANGVYDFADAGAVPVISTQPMNRLGFDGGGITFSVTASADTHQWQVSTDGGLTFSNITNGGIYSGALTSTLTINPVDLSNNNYQYRVVLSNSSFVCGDTTSTVANLTARVRTVITNRRITPRVNK